MSTLAVGIFNVYLGKDKEAAKNFRQFAAYLHGLQSDAIVKIGEFIEWQLQHSGAVDLNIYKYGESFKFPDDALIKSPRCIYGHDYT